MTYEEAIKKLRLLNELIGNNPNVLDVPYSKGELFGFKAGLNLAIEALQKQVPMKPRKFERIPHARCPQCNNTVKMYCDAHEYHHCLFCGQRLDWSDKK